MTAIYAFETFVDVSKRTSRIAGGNVSVGAGSGQAQDGSQRPVSTSADIADRAQHVAISGRKRTKFFEAGNEIFEGATLGPRGFADIAGQPRFIITNQARITDDAVSHHRGEAVGKRSSSGIPALRRPSIAQSPLSRARGSVWSFVNRALSVFQAAIVLGPIGGSARYCSSASWASGRPRPVKASAADEAIHANGLFGL